MIKNYIRNIRGFKPVELVVLVSMSLLIASGFFFGLSNNQPASINVNVQPPEVTVYVDGQQMAASRTPGAMAAGTDQYVAPSGDTSGVTDANNIENAMKAVSATGATVYLTDGNSSTVDNYYTSRNIVTDGFNGTLKGENWDNTIINAGRKSPAEGDGFQPAYSPLWDMLGYQPILPVVLQLENSTGLVTIADLTIQVLDEQPTDLIPDYYGNLRTTIGTMIDIQAGDNNTDFYNVRMLGKATDAPGNYKGTNVMYGFHDMDYFGSPKGSRKPLLTMRNIEVENMGGGGIFAMNFEEINIEGVIAKNVGEGIVLARVEEVTVEDNTIEATSVGISFTRIPAAVADNNTISIIGEDGWSSIGVWYSPDAVITNNAITGNTVYGVNVWPASASGALIQGNTFENAYGEYGVVSLEESDNSEVFFNTFINVSGPRGAVWVTGNENTIRGNDYSDSGLPGLPGALSVQLGDYGWVYSTSDPGNQCESSPWPNWYICPIPVQDNHIIETVSPTGKTFPLGTNLCTQILDFSDDWDTEEYDGLNQISGINACNGQWGSILEHLEGIEPGTPPTESRKERMLMELHR